MASRTDVELRIRAKNLASKDINGLNSELNKLVDTQERQASSAALASRSIRDLNAEQKSLAAISGELARRKNLIEQLLGRQSDLTAAKKRLNAVRAELANLLQTKNRGTFLGDIDKAIKNVRRELASAEKEVNSTTRAFDRVGASLSGIGVDSANAGQALREIDTAMNRSNVAIERQTADLNRHSAATLETAAATRKLAEAERFQNEQLAKRNMRTTQAVNTFMAPGAEAALASMAASRASAEAERKAQERIAGVRNRLVEVLNRQASAAAKETEASRRSTAATRDNTNAANANAGARDRQGRSIRQAGSALSLFNDTGRKSLSVYQRVRGQVLQLGAAYLGIYQGIKLVSDTLDAVNKRQGLQIKLRVANDGDAKKAADDFIFLRKTADDLGLVFVDLAASYANYKIAAQSAGVSNGLIRQSFLDVSKAISVNRLAAEDADGVLRALVQIFSKARVQAEELRGQLGDRLPGAVALFAKANNIALSDLDEKLKKGELGVGNLIQFLRENAKTVESEIPAATNTAQASINRMKNAYQDFLVVLGESGVTDKLKEIADKLTIFFKSADGKETIRNLSVVMTGLADVFLFFLQNIDKVILALKIFLGLQVLKFGTDITLSLVGVIGKLMDLRKWLLATSAATGVLTVAARGLAFALGPWGLLIAGVSTALFFLTKQEDKAETAAKTYGQAVEDLKKAQGEQLVTEIDRAIKARETAKRDLQAAKAVLIRKEAEAQLAEQRAANTSGKGAEAAFGTRALKDAEAAQAKKLVDALEAKINDLNNGIDGASRRRVASLREEARIAAKNAEDLNKLLGQGTGKGDEEEKNRLGRLADERKRIEDKAADDVLDIQKQLSQARIETEVTTQAQIGANLKNQLDVIATEIEKKRIDLEELKTEANKLGAPKAVASANFALEQLRTLKDVQDARAREEALAATVALKDKNINDLIAKRKGEIDLVNAQVEAGVKSEADGRNDIVAIQQRYRAEIVGAATDLINFLNTLPSDVFARLGAEKLIANLKLAVAEANNVKTNLQLIVDNLGGQFSQGAATALGVFAKGIAGAIQNMNSLGDAFQAAKNSFLDFAADFLIQIGQMIMQAILLRAIQNAFNGTSGGFLGAVQSAFTGASHHSGGIVGQDGTARLIPADVMRNARRFHDGGMPGLRSDEVPAILQKGEEVLTANDPRHANNLGAGAAGSPTMDVSIVNAIDSAALFEAGGNTRAGRKVIFNIIRANRSDFKKLLA